MHANLVDISHGSNFRESYKTGSPDRQTGILPLCWSCSGCWGPVCCSEWPSGRPGSYSSHWDLNLPPAPGRTSSGGCSGSHSRCAGMESPETTRSKWLRVSFSKLGLD